MDMWWSDLILALLTGLPVLLPLVGQEWFIGPESLTGGAPMLPPTDFSAPDFAASNLAAPFADPAAQYLINPLPGSYPTPADPSFGGGVEKLASYARGAAPVLSGLTTAASIPLSIAGLSEATRGRKALERGIQTQERAAAPQIAAEERLLPAATEAMLTGTVPPEVEADIQNKVNAWEQTQLQNLTRQGIDANTARAMLAQQRTQIETTLRMQWAQSAIKTGEGAAGGAASAAAGASLFGGEEYQTSGQALQQANLAMYRLMGATA